MKHIFLLAVAYTVVSCGSVTDDHSSHDHSAETTCAEGHDHSKEEHNHAEEDHSGHDHAQEAKKSDEHAHEGGITLSVEQAKALGLTYEIVKPADFSAAIRTSGIIEPSTNDNSTIIANVSGVVKIDINGLNLGSQVGKGVRIFSIEAGSLVDNNVSNRFEIAKSALEKAKSDYDRVLSLSKDAMATATQVEEVKLALKTAQKNYDALSKATMIESPMSGYITSIDVKNGDYVNEGQQLATVSSGKSLVIKADLPSKYFHLISSISSANFTTPYDAKSYSLHQLNGRLISKGNTVNQNSYSVPIVFSVENRAQLIAGTAIEVFLITTKKSDIISVPVGSLTEEQGAFYVYIKTCVDTYEKVAVKIGNNNGERVEIQSGLHSGDDVVTSGAYFVRLASASNAIPHGHAH